MNLSGYFDVRNVKKYLVQFDVLPGLILIRIGFQHQLFKPLDAIAAVNHFSQVEFRVLMNLDGKLYRNAFHSLYHLNIEDV